MGGTSFGGGGGGGGGIDVPAVRESEMDASSFGSLNRDVGVRFGVSNAAPSDSIFRSTMNREASVERRYAYGTDIVQVANREFKLGY